ncbi:MAG: biotin--[acetyl-CoA-carboxylase] ligase [Deltaproteobacteria bacterium HGW-Deltaproteobacteria-8]|nr:MAG: biotin--[acetyl-CoA-carboxylase] ligase [Deltaproteobacteria bacterium HGW-Deltaproteobacteria-8]
MIASCGLDGKRLPPLEKPVPADISPAPSLQLPRGLRILALGLPGLAEPLDPQSLASVHPLWAADVEALGPWRLEQDRVWLPGSPQGADISVCGPCSSTMDVARELVARGELGVFGQGWGSVIAPTQTGGRGQLRRAWLSSPGNVLATLVMPPAEGLWNDLRPLVLGHLLAEALGDVCGDVRVKWPNDLLLDDHKIGGILVEERPGCILAGIGLNLAWAPREEELRQGHCVAAGCFPAISGVSGVLGLWRMLVNRLETGYLSLLETFTPGDFLTIFQSRLAWKGRRVLVTEGAGVRYKARIKGVSGKGELVLDHEGREILLLAGDVTPV